MVSGIQNNRYPLNMGEAVPVFDHNSSSSRMTPDDFLNNLSQFNRTRALKTSIGIATTIPSSPPLMKFDHTVPLGMHLLQP